MSLIAPSPRPTPLGTVLLRNFKFPDSEGKLQKAGISTRVRWKIEFTTGCSGPTVPYRALKTVFPLLKVHLTPSFLIVRKEI